MTTDLTARPTIYNGIPMRSRLEARVAGWLDSLGVSWEYEGSAFASGTKQYLPDFRLPAFGGDRDLFIEIKGTVTDDVFHKCVTKLEVIQHSRGNADLALATEWLLERGEVIGKLEYTPWAPMYFMRCPCGHLMLGHSPFDDAAMLVSKCGKCGDVAYRTDRAGIITRMNAA